MWMHTHGQSHLLLAVHTVGLDLLQCGVKEVCDRFREKGKLHLLHNWSHKGEESWN